MCHNYIGLRILKMHGQDQFDQVKLTEEVVILKIILDKKVINLIMIFTQYDFSERIVFVNESSLVY